MKNKTTGFGCGGCFLVITIVWLFIMLVLASCSPKLYRGEDSSYRGKINKVQYVVIDGAVSMYLHTDKYIIQTDYDRRVEVNDSVYIYETAPTSFYKPFRWAVVNGIKIPIK